MFLKHLSLANFLIIKESSLYDLLAFIYKVIERHFLFFLYSESHFVAKVFLSSNLYKKKI